MSDHRERTGTEERVSIWSVRPRVKKFFYALFCTVVLGIVGLEALDLARMVDGAAVDNRLMLDTVRGIYRGLGESAAPAIMVTVPVVMAITEVLELIMVLSEWLLSKIERDREKLREEGRKEVREEVWREWETWNQLRLEAEKKGEPFDIPPPTPEDQGAGAS